MTAKELIAQLIILPNSDVDILDSVSGLPLKVVSIEHYDAETTAILVDAPGE